MNAMYMPQDMIMPVAVSPAIRVRISPGSSRSSFCASSLAGAGAGVCFGPLEAANPWGVGVGVGGMERANDTESESSGVGVGVGVGVAVAVMVGIGMRVGVDVGPGVRVAVGVGTTVGYQ